MFVFFFVVFYAEVFADVDDVGEAVMLADVNDVATRFPCHGHIK